MPQLTPSPNKRHDRRTLRQEIQDLFDGSIRKRFPQLLGEEVFSFSRLEGTSQQHYGDYISINVLTICQRLRSLNSEFFSQKRPQAIAKELIQEVKQKQKSKQKSLKMLDKLEQHDVGYITFNLSSEWMVQRIKKMLIDGIDTWAPINLKRAVVSFPTPAIGADLHADDIRSCYISQMLSRMLWYAGVAVGSREYSDKCLDAVKRCFFEDQGVITSVRGGTPLFQVKGEALGRTFLNNVSNGTPLFQVKGEALGRTFLNNVSNDLGTLWYAIKEQGGELIVFVTPVRQWEHVQQCFAAAKTVKWLPGKWNPAVLSCGYRTSETESEKLAYLWKIFDSHPKAAYLLRLGQDAGYSEEESFDCAIKYTYLKTHRLAECVFNIDEMLDVEGDSFVYLLKTKAIISSRLKNPGSRGMVVFTKAFFERERELEVHLVQFTEVIDRACLTFKLHLVCEYLLSLCKKFTRYRDEVLQHLDSKTFSSKLFLYDASSVVMDKCFHLLGINSRFLGTSSKVMLSELKRVTMEDHFIPLPVSDPRPEHLNPRFEMFGMNIVVLHPDFENGELFGIVSLIDKEGLLSDQRLPLEENNHGHVSYFYHEWDESIGIGRSSDVFFGNPSPPCSAPFSSAIDINATLYAVTAGKDKCYQLLDCQEPIPLSDFWYDKLDFSRGTLKLGTKDGCIYVDYILLRDALDSSMNLRFDLPKGSHEMYVTGTIRAYYGNGVLDSCDESSKDRYKAILFQADAGCKLEAGPLKMKKSVMAVPSDGLLMIEAVIFDVKAGKYVLDTTEELHPDLNNHGECCFALENGGCFSLTVEWTKGPKCLIQ